jgi:hypothetical protein
VAQTVGAGELDLSLYGPLTLDLTATPSVAVADEIVCDGMVVEFLDAAALVG